MWCVAKNFPHDLWSIYLNTLLDHFTQEIPASLLFPECARHTPSQKCCICHVVGSPSPDVFAQMSPSQLIFHGLPYVKLPLPLPGPLEMFILLPCVIIFFFFHGTHHHLTSHMCTYIVSCKGRDHFACFVHCHIPSTYNCFWHIVIQKVRVIFN